MLLWYGVERFKEAYTEEIIIEHHDNNAFNCLIENLSFAPNSVNLAKAHLYDKERKKALPVAGINFFKDFKSQRYQITIGFNEVFFGKIDDEPVFLTTLHLLYEDDFRIVYQDVSLLTYQLMEYKRFDLNQLNHVGYDYREAPFVIPIANEDQELPELPVWIEEEDGELLFVINPRKGHFLKSVAAKKDLFNKE